MVVGEAAAAPIWVVGGEEGTMAICMSLADVLVGVRVARVRGLERMCVASAV